MKKSIEEPFGMGDFIKHELFMDIALCIEYAYDNGDSWRVTGYWWNQMFVKSGLVPFKDLKKRRSRDPYSYGGGYGPDTQTFDIKKSELSKWSKVKMPPRSQCLRKCEWVKVA